MKHISAQADPTRTPRADPTYEPYIPASARPSQIHTYIFGAKKLNQVDDMRNQKGPIENERIQKRYDADRHQTLSHIKVVRTCCDSLKMKMTHTNTKIMTKTGKNFQEENVLRHGYFAL